MAKRFQFQFGPVNCSCNVDMLPVTMVWWPFWKETCSGKFNNSCWSVFQTKQTLIPLDTKLYSLLRKHTTGPDDQLPAVGPVWKYKLYIRKSLRSEHDGAGECSEITGNLNAKQITFHLMHSKVLTIIGRLRSILYSSQMYYYKN